MKMTLYISDKACKYLREKENMSRYVSELIIGDCECTNKAIDIDKIVSAIVDRLVAKAPCKSNVSVIDTNDIHNSISSILKI